MRILICFLLIFSLSFSGFAASESGSSDTLDAVAAAVQSKVSLPAHFTNFSSYIQLDEYDSRTYFTWSGEDTTSAQGGSVTVGIDAQNRIVQYDFYEYGNYAGDYRLATIDRDQAQAIALAQVTRICPEFAAHVQVKEQPNMRLRNNQTYQFIFYRYENNIPYYPNYIRAQVDAHSGKLSQLMVTWEDFDTIASPSKSISPAAATDWYYDRTGWTLGYVLDQNGQGVLTYAPNLDGKSYISPYDGGRIATGRQVPTTDFAKKGFGPMNLVPVEEQTVPMGLPSFDQLEKTARGIGVLGLTMSYTRTNQQYYNDSQGEQYARLWFARRMEPKKEVSVAFRLSDSNLIYISRTTDKEENNKQLSPQQCLQIAKKAAEALQPDRFDLCLLTKGVFDDAPTDPYMESFQFSRQVSGLPLFDDGILVWVSRATGEVCLFRTTWHDNATFPLQHPTLSARQAFDGLVAQHPLELQYTAVQKRGKAELHPAYAFPPQTTLFINGQTGQLTDAKGNIPAPALITFDDIAGHPCQPYVQTLLDCGILPYEQSFRPDDLILRDEFLQWTANTLKDGAIPIQQVLRKDDNQSDILTNIQAVKYIIRMMGWQNAAELPDTYHTHFVNAHAIASEDIGYAAIAEGLGIIGGNAFVPDLEITRGIAAELLYHLIGGERIEP